ncbi:MAG: REP-associated tyrosine transposase [Marinibacterium sp.]
MPNYRRIRLPGASYFFTIALADRSSSLLTDRIDDLRGAYGATMRTMPVRCDAMVVLPDHLHAVWTLPPGDSAYSERWRKIKHRFTRMVGKTAHPTDVSPSKRRKRECGIWQRRFWEHTIRDENDYRLHVAYCWGNPVKHGLVASASEWPFSSIHRDIREGRVDPEWAVPVIEGTFGE